MAMTCERRLSGAHLVSTATFVESSKLLPLAFWYYTMLSSQADI